MSILLAILKIIGIVLLCVIGLVIFIILLILFCPMMYRIKADHNEENTEVDFSFRYLLVKGVGSFKKGDGLKYKVKFLFLTLIDSEKKEDDSEDDGIDVMDLDPNEDFVETGFFDDTPETPSQETIESENIETVAQETETTELETTGTEIIDSTDDEEIEVVEEVSVAESEGFDQLPKKEQKKLLKAEKKRKKEEKKRLKEEKKKAKGDKSVTDTIDEKLEKVSEKLDKIAEKSDKLAKKIDHIDQFLDKPFVQKTIKRVFKIIKRLFGTIKPKKSKGYLHFGLKSAASTGEALAKLAQIYPLYGRWLVIDPDFYHKVIEGNVDIKGRIYVFRFVGPALRLLISRDFWRTYKLAKKI